MVGGAPRRSHRPRQATEARVSRRIIFRPAARRDVDDIAEHISADSIDAALRFFDAVDATGRRLASDPGIGRKREFGHPDVNGLRAVAVDGFPRHILFYIHDAKTVTIARVLHGSRDLDRALADE